MHKNNFPFQWVLLSESKISWMFNHSFAKIIWAPSSEFVSLSIPSWQILTAHAQPFRGARDLAFFLKVPLDSLLIWASSEGSGETARMRRLAWTFAARIGYKYQIRLTRSILFKQKEVIMPGYYVWAPSLAWRQPIGVAWHYQLFITEFLCLGINTDDNSS